MIRGLITVIITTIAMTATSQQWEKHSIKDRFEEDTELFTWGATVKGVYKNGTKKISIKADIECTEGMYAIFIYTIEGTTEKLPEISKALVFAEVKTTNGEILQVTLEQSNNIIKEYPDGQRVDFNRGQERVLYSMGYPLKEYNLRQGSGGKLLIYFYDGGKQILIDLPGE